MQKDVKTRRTAWPNNGLRTPPQRDCGHGRDEAGSRDSEAARQGAIDATEFASAPRPV